MHAQKYMVTEDDRCQTLSKLSIPEKLHQPLTLVFPKVRRNRSFQATSLNNTNDYIMMKSATDLLCF